MREWFSAEPTPFETHAIVALLAVLAWVWLGAPLWKLCRARVWAAVAFIGNVIAHRMIGLGRVRHVPRKAWLIGVAILAVVFVIGFWAGRNREIPRQSGKFEPNHGDRYASAENFRKYAEALRAFALRKSGPPVFESAAANSVPTVAERVQRTVVQVTGSSYGNEPLSGGTGFFVSADGLVVTCWHVVALADIGGLRLTRSDGSTCEIEGVLGFSATNDLVVLKAAVAGVDFLSLRRSDEKPSPGTRVLVFGNPGTLRGVWSEGVASGFQFDRPGGQNMLAFTAPIAPGSSGSPVVDLEKGDALGVASKGGGLFGNLAVPSIDVIELLERVRGSTPVPVARFKEELAKEKPDLKAKVFDRERAGDFMEAGRLCDEFTARYPEDVWGKWEHAQIAFGSEDCAAANPYLWQLIPIKDPGDEFLGAMQFECGDELFGPANERQTLKRVAELLSRDYGVQICTVQMPPDRGLNAREKPDAASGVLQAFAPGQHLFAREERIRNRGGTEDVTWRKVLLLPSKDRIHGGEGWVNERHLAPLNLAVIDQSRFIAPPFGFRWKDSFAHVESVLQGVNARIISRDKTADGEVWKVEGLAAAGLRRTIFEFRKGALSRVELQYRYQGLSSKQYDKKLHEIGRYFDMTYGPRPEIDSTGAAPETGNSYRRRVGNTSLAVLQRRSDAEAAGDIIFAYWIRL